MKKLRAFFQKYPKSCLFALALVLTGVFAAMGQQFADNAKTQTGFVILCVLQGLCALAFFFIVKYLAKHGAGDPE